ncbi:MAG: hypothetical protein AAB880_00610 [Patescibacteria group bacterium]
MPELIFETQTLGETRVCRCYLPNGETRRLVASMGLSAEYKPEIGIELDVYLKNEILRWADAKHHN